MWITQLRKATMSTTINSRNSIAHDYHPLATSEQKSAPTAPHAPIQHSAHSTPAQQPVRQIPLAPNSLQVSMVKSAIAAKLNTPVAFTARNQSILNFSLLHKLADKLYDFKYD